MKAKRLGFIGCLAATAVISSPLMGEQQKNSVTTSHSRIHRTTSPTAQVTAGSQRNTNSSYRGTRRYAAPQRYVGTRQYSGSRVYTQNRYASRGYYGNTRYYYGDPHYSYGASTYPYYSYYSSWPSASYGYYPYGGYPYSYYGGYANSYSYYQPRYTYYQRQYGGYDDATVAAVQRRLGELGYGPGIVDGVVGPQTRAAIAAFQSTNGMVVDGVITTRLLERMGLT